MFFAVTDLCTRIKWNEDTHLCLHIHASNELGYCLLYYYIKYFACELWFIMLFWCP
jgi:hypothetical protein